MFKKILIANRGEIALRILRACRELNIQTVSIYSEADENAMHVRMADESVCVGPPPSQLSYLNIPAIITAATITNVDAIHPGYGFLSENIRFAEIIEEHGYTFIGPKSQHIKLMGNKISSKKIMSTNNVPIIPSLYDVENSEKLKEFINQYKKNNSSASLISTNISDPKGYGRIIRKNKKYFFFDIFFYLYYFFD